MSTTLVEYWLGEAKYIYMVAIAENGVAFTITSAKIVIETNAGVSVLAETNAEIVSSESAEEQEVRYLWQPTERGTYFATFKYVVGLETKYHKMA